MSKPFQPIDDLLALFESSKDQLGPAIQQVFGEDWQISQGDVVHSRTEDLLEMGISNPGICLQYQNDQDQEFLLLLPEGEVGKTWLDAEQEETHQKLQSLIEAIRGILPAEHTSEAVWEPDLLDRLMTDLGSDYAGIIPFDLFSESDPALGQPLFVVGLGNAPAQEHLETEDEPFSAVNGLLDEIDPVQALDEDGLDDVSADFPDESYEDELVEDFTEAEFSEQTETSAEESLDGMELVQRVRRVLPLQVVVSVRVAEKKIDIEQLIRICPGTLIMFQKSCDDLLDLYVNNIRFAQGEAVKIGEKFGLKVNEVGGKQTREPGVFSL